MQLHLFPPDAPAPTPQERFEQFHAQNPHVYAALRDAAVDEAGASQEQVMNDHGSDNIAEALRHVFTPEELVKLRRDVQMGTASPVLIIERSSERIQLEDKRR